MNSFVSNALWLSEVKSCFLVHLKGWQMEQMAASCIPPPRSSAVTVGGGWQLLDCVHCVCFQFSSVQSLSRVRLFATPWTAACQASLSITNSRSLLKHMSIEPVIPSNHLILCCPLLLPSIFPSIRVFSNESVYCIRWPKYWSSSFSISASSEASFTFGGQKLVTAVTFFAHWCDRRYFISHHQSIFCSPGLWPQPVEPFITAPPVLYLLYLAVPSLYTRWMPRCIAHSSAQWRHSLSTVFQDCTWERLPSAATYSQLARTCWVSLPTIPSLGFSSPFWLFRIVHKSTD